MKIRIFDLKALFGSPRLCYLHATNKTFIKINSFFICINNKTYKKTFFITK